MNTRDGLKRKSKLSLRFDAMKRFAVLTLLLVSALAHEHEMEDVGPYEFNFTNEEPLDNTLRLHIALQVLSWGIIFPLGMVLGLVKRSGSRWARWHVPVQTLGVGTFPLSRRKGGANGREQGSH